MSDDLAEARRVREVSRREGVTEWGALVACRRCALPFFLADAHKEPASAVCPYCGNVGAQLGSS